MTAHGGMGSVPVKAGSRHKVSQPLVFCGLCSMSLTADTCSDICLVTQFLIR